MQLRAALLLTVGALCACPSKKGPPPLFESNCTVGKPPAEAKLTAGPIDSNSAILPGGRKITAAGTVLKTGGYPIALRILPGDRYAVLSDDAVHDQMLRLVDLAAPDPTNPVVSSIDYPLTENNDHAPGMFYGLALSADGTRLYVSDGGYDPVPDSEPMDRHYNTVEVYDLVGSPPQLVKNDTLTLRLYFQSQQGFANRVPSGIALSSDGKLLYVACQGDSSLAILTLDQTAFYGAEIGTAPVVGLDPYDVAVDETTRTAFVSLWGGDTFASGVAVDGVVPVDVSNPQFPVASTQVIPTGKASEAEIMLAGRIYVVNADADTVSVIDAASHAVQSAPVDASAVLGATPNNLAIDVARNRLYVANGNENAVVVLNLATLSIIGHVPTGWYPTAVAVRGDGSLVIASSRGLGFGPGGASIDTLRAEGIVQVVPLPSDADLQAWTPVVQQNLDRPRSLQAPVTCANVPVSEQRFPLAVAPGAPAAITHVFMIVKENKTYDDVLADVPGGNGDVSLQEWPAKYTPNAHKLATTFVLLDNFYANAELSLQGHEWTTGDWNNDYVEKGWGATEDYGRGYRSDYAFTATGLGRLGYPGSDSVFVHLDKANVRYHNYGEITNLLGAKIALDPYYPGLVFDTSILDIVKEQYVAGAILAQGEYVEPFSYILLPNDHTSATKDGSLEPYSMVADNDEAMGKFVDDISHSPLWPSSLIMILEDDPGDGGDHVEQHRSFCLMASPWLKRGYISSSIFDMGSVYRAILNTVGAPSMNLHDQHAAGFYELINTVPDLTPYDYVPRQIPLQMVKKDAPMREESNRMDFSKPDQQDLSRVLWKYTHGADAEPPWLKPGAKPERRRDPDD
jgi:YVTN family beta-propeller protein